MDNEKESILALRKIMGGYRKSRVLFTANNFRVFDHLSSPKSAKTLAHELSLDLRGTTILLDALVALELLGKVSSKYFNTDLSTKFLVSDSPDYQGDIVSHSDSLWKRWSNLDEVVRTGKPAQSTQDHKTFIMAMDNIAKMKVGDVIEAIGLEGVKSVIDVGGGPGTYSMQMAGKGVDVTLFDRPETISIAKEFIDKAGVCGIGFMAGDFNADDIGSGYDLALLSQVVHSNSDKENTALVKKVKKALNENGRIVIHEFYIDENMATPAEGALFSVNMLVNTQEGRCYPVEEIKEWLAKAGLHDIDHKLINDTVIVTAVKRDK
ncbi:MAG: methyltransferase domain-containing protein [Nitrospirae bacterium]|nr:methyltransferase domain-containing protein [Nitrospirota bacterium]